MRWRTPEPTQPRVLLLTRPGCHLCQSAVEVVTAVCAQTGNEWAERNVDDDEDLRRRYTDQVPVTFVDGQQHDFWRVDEGRLRRALADQPA